MADDIKTAVNHEMSEMGKMLVQVFSVFLEKKLLSERNWMKAG